MRYWIGWVLLCILLVVTGCGGPSAGVNNTAAATAAQSSAAPVATQPATPTNTPVRIAAPPTPTPAATAPPAPSPTNTPAPTATPAEPTPLPPTPTAEPTAVAALPEGMVACLPLAETAGVRQALGVVPPPYAAPPASTAELHAGGGRGYQFIHLGFDVEGSPEYLGELLDVLDRRGVKTTMYIVGGWAELYPDWIQTMHSRGHEMANHSWSHGNFREFDAAQVADELQRTEDIVVRLTGQSTQPWFRPPFGSRSDLSIQTAADNGWTTVIWSGSSDDWRPEYGEEEMCASLKQGGYPGAILYAHTYRPEIPAAVDRFIGEMQQQGYVFVPLSVMMSADPALYLQSN